MAKKRGHPIHLVYRISMLGIEPVLTFIGSYQAFFHPSTALAEDLPGLLPHDAAKQNALIYQLGGFWLLFALIEVLVLGYSGYRNVRIWRSVAVCILASDVCFVATLGIGNGWKTSFWSPWGSQSVTYATTVAIGVSGLLLRAGLVAGLGLDTSDSDSSASTARCSAVWSTDGAGAQANADSKPTRFRM